MTASRLLLVLALVFALVPFGAKAQEAPVPDDDPLSEGPDVGVEVDLTGVWDDLTDRRGDVRRAAKMKLIAAAEYALPAILEHADSPDPRVRHVCTERLGTFTGESVWLALLRRLGDDDREVAALAFASLLSKAGGAFLEALPDLVPKLDDPDFDLLRRLVDAARRRSLFEALAKYRGAMYGSMRYPGQYARIVDDFRGAVQLLSEFLENESRFAEEGLGSDWTLESARTVAVQALGDSGSPDAVAPLEAFFDRLVTSARRGRNTIWFNGGNVRYNPVYDQGGATVALALHQLGVTRYAEEMLEQQEMLSGATNWGWNPRATQVAQTYLEMGDTRKARAAFLEQVKPKPNSYYWRMEPAAYVHLGALALIVESPERGDCDGDEESGDAPGADDDDDDNDSARASFTPDARAAREREAVEYITKAIEFGMIDASWFRIDRRFDSLRENADYIDVIARLERLLRAQGLTRELGEDD